MVIRELQLLPLMSCDFSENQYGDSVTLLMGTNEVSLVLKTFFVPILQKLVQKLFRTRL